MFVRDVAQALEAAGVRFAIVGGLAVNLYGIPRTTYVVDLVVARETEQLTACRRALEALGLRCRLPIALKDLARASDEELAARNLVAVTFTDPAMPLREVDVMVRPAVPVASLLSRARLLESAELALPVVCLADLVALKRAAGRPQDLADLRHLERLLPKEG